VRDAGLPDVHGVLLDLGVSSMQLDEGERGFAFRHDGPLDMRMAARAPAPPTSCATPASKSSPPGCTATARSATAAAWRARSSRPATRRRSRPPGASVEVVQAAYPPGPRRDHPARRTFQALRLVVNDELGALEEALAAAIEVLAPGGRLVVLAYHSLEDRIVKHALRDRRDLRPLHKRPLEPTEAEIAANPRARSAKLRSAEKVEAPREPPRAQRRRPLRGRCCCCSPAWAPPRSCATAPRPACSPTRSRRSSPSPPRARRRQRQRAARRHHLGAQAGMVPAPDAPNVEAVAPGLLPPPSAPPTPWLEVQTVWR
jgi:hypothetical protein